MYYMNIKHIKEHVAGALPIAISAISLIVTITIFVITNNLIEKQINTEFKSEAESIHATLEGRLQEYVSLLVGGRGLFQASDNVNRDEWNKYVTNFDIENKYSGIQGIGYSEIVYPEDKESYEQSVRDEGFEDFVIRPEGERDIYTSIIFLEPFDERNKQAFGFDMFQEITRNTAMTSAYETGNPALSGKVTLVQEIDEDVQSGFLIYLPIYEKNVSLNTVSDRKNATKGYVYSPFRMNNFMDDIVGKNNNEIRVEVYDGVDGEITAERKMYSADISPEERKKYIRAHEQIVTVGDHGWTVQYITTDNYGKDVFRTYTPIAILLVGTILSAGIFFVLRGLNVDREKAISMAEKITHDLRIQKEEKEKTNKELEKANKLLEDQKKELEIKVAEIEKSSHFMVGREEKMAELKKEIAELRKKRQK